MGVILEKNSVRLLESGQVSRAHLESLTTADLIKMADNNGIDIPPDLDRIFIIEELLEIPSADEIPEDTMGMSGTPEYPTDPGADGSAASDIFSEEDSVNSGLVESVPLPKQYNFTFIEVMVRDPLWAFVFWEIKAQDKEQFENAQGFNGYYLKVSPRITSDRVLVNQDDADWRGTGTKGVFTVPVNPEDAAWYLGLSPAEEQRQSCSDQNQVYQTQYKVELCVSLGGEETVLAVSNPFTLPLLHEYPSEGTGICDNPLVRLSGYMDFRILRNNERLFRTKRGAPADSHG